MMEYPMFRVFLYALMLAGLMLLVGTPTCAAGEEEEEAPRPLARVPQVDAVPAPQVVVNPPDLCDGPAAAMRLEVSKVGMSVPSYPCEVIRTYEAIEATRGRGFWMGVVPRSFLKIRLVSKGLFSALFGIIGLG